MKYYIKKHQTGDKIKHKVSKGDTPATIAKAYNINLDDFYKYNPGLTATNLKLGKEYYIIDPSVRQVGTKRYHFLKRPVYEGLSFDDVYAHARQNGDNVFWYKDKPYNTEYKTVWKTPHLNNKVGQQQDKTAQQLWNYLRFEKNLTKEQAAAIMGNVMQESRMGISKQQADGDKAQGFMQLHGENLNNYNRWKQINEAPWEDIDYFLAILNNPADLDWRQKEWDRAHQNYLNGTHVDYFQKQFKNEQDKMKYSYAEMAEKWKNNPNDLKLLTELITTYFEKAGDPKLEKRNGYALSYYNSYGQTEKKSLGGTINYLNLFKK